MRYNTSLAHFFLLKWRLVGDIGVYIFDGFECSFSTAYQQINFFLCVRYAMHNFMCSMWTENKWKKKHNNFKLKRTCKHVIVPPNRYYLIWSFVFRFFIMKKKERRRQRRRRFSNRYTVQKWFCRSRVTVHRTFIHSFVI